MKFRDKGGTKLVFTTAVILVMLVLITSPASASRIQLEKYVTNPNGFEEGDVIDFTIFVGNPATNPYINTQDVTDYMPDGTVVVLEYNLVLNPGESTIYHVQHTVTAADVVAGEVINTVRLDGSDSNEDIIEAATQARADITEIFEPPESDEFWAVEWFQTDPHQYTQFNLPDDQLYLTTLSWLAPESYIHIWDGPTGGDYAYEGERVKFIHDPYDRTDDIYFNQRGDDVLGSVRVHGTFGEGPGDHDFEDPVTGLKPENAPYTDAMGPFYPQSEQAPIKDHVTFNPAIMFHNDDGMPWDRILSYGTNAEGEKVFKRMSYEKDLFKDENGNGCFDVVLRNGNDLDSDMVICLDDERETIIGLLTDMSQDWHILTENDRLTVNGVKADIYAPAIIQDFTYMFLDDMMPIPVDSGSTVLIPMANDPNVASVSGLNSFEPALDGVLEGVEVESEKTLGIDIDGDDEQRPMDPDGEALSGDESVVLVLRQQYLEPGDSIQFFDHVITLDNVGEFDAQSKAVFTVSDNEGAGYTMSTSGVILAPSEVQTFYRADDNPAATEAPAFYLKVETASYQDGDKYAYVEVGRLFGHPGANIAKNKYHSQKAFWVQDVYYNVVALKTYPVDADNSKERIKYITFREKLPKADVKVHNHHFKVWDTYELLPEMAPFCMDHRVVDDVNDEWTHDKIGPIVPAVPLEIRYIDETGECRFFGELKEIYTESDDLEYWMVEWFATMPYQYTEFQIMERFECEKRLFTSAFIAPESCIHMWNGGEDEGPMFTKEGERAKFWFDDNYDPLYVDNGELKIFGTFGEGPGDHDFEDPVTGLKPENAPYTDAMGPFYPQSNQAPIKDHVTFNPAIMYHNDDGMPWDRILSYGTNAEAEKVFKRMSYEKDLFKDENGNGCFDVVLERSGSEIVVCLENEDLIHDYLSNGWVILTENNRLTVDGVKADIYAPAIIQEFTYMFLDDMMPMAVDSGSTVLIPMANDGFVGSGSGLNSFVPGPDDIVKGVQVESEYTLGLDIDGDGDEDPMDPDGQPLSGDESVVLVLKHQLLVPGDSIQFFDHVVTLDNVGQFDAQSKAIFTIADNEGAGYDMVSSGIMLATGDVQTFYRADDNPADSEAPAFYIKLETASYQPEDKFAYIEIGRLFGHPGANIAKNQYHSQKAFWVQDVYYNVVALKTYPADNSKEKIKYITFREKLPKEFVKVHNHHFKVWGVNDRLPEMAPFCMDHNIMDDVQYGWEWPIQKIGDERGVCPLVITYTEETDEPRFHGELKEIYWEKDNGGVEEDCLLDMNTDGYVNVQDLVWLLTNGEWGYNPDHVWDLNTDDYVNVQDAVYALTHGHWGQCPSS